MRLYEFQNDDSEQVKLTGIISQLYGRIVDTDTDKKFSLKSLINILAKNGFSVSEPEFREMAKVPPLSNLIANVTGDSVVFKGQDDSNEVVAPDQTSKTLDKMAKRAAKKD